MQLFTFATTLQCADYIKISSNPDQHCCQQNSSKLRILCLPYLKNASLKFFVYSILILLSLDLISFWGDIGLKGVPLYLKHKTHLAF
ncbi:hypothetical protein O3M35_010548 [Rhynocoris fuscipes]|uniref:Uncharacterized protein n=1 Tax=Rhynocoris fuscipes TaxID=488301 RepID=A0AAW1D1N5_9HEMI